MQQKQSKQASLAQALIDSLGLEGAISACRANGWDGVLLHVLGAGRTTARRAEKNAHT